MRQAAAPRSSLTLVIALAHWFEARIRAERAHLPRT